MARTYRRIGGRHETAAPSPAPETKRRRARLLSCPTCGRLAGLDRFAAPDIYARERVLGGYRAATWSPPLPPTEGEIVHLRAALQRALDRLS